MAEAFDACGRAGDDTAWVRVRQHRARYRIENPNRNRATNQMAALRIWHDCGALSPNGVQP